MTFSDLNGEPRELTTSVEGRVVAITGVASGIGHALGRCFQSDGAIVFGCDLPGVLDGANEVCDDVRPCDVSDAGQVEDWIAGVAERAPRIDVLIANAGVHRYGTLQDSTIDDLDLVVKVDLLGVMYCNRAALRVMQAKGTGRIVNVVSRAAERCRGDMPAYNAAKAGVIALTSSLADALKGSDILVNNIIPGFIRTAANPLGTAEPQSCYPTARMLATLPEGGPSGRTFFEESEYPMYVRP